MTTSASILSSLYRQRGLVAVLVERELKARYRGTFLGFFWSLLNPLLLLAVYTVIFTYIIPARVPSRVPYPLFLFAGLLPWLFASGSLLDSAVILPDNGPLLRKVVCSPEVFPTVVVVSHFVHHLLALPVLLVALAVVAVVQGIAFPWTVVLLPLVLAIWVAAVAGLALAVAALAVHFRDLKDLLHNALTLVFFMTPIVYARELVPEGVLRRAVTANPVTPLITIYRSVVVEGVVPAASYWGWSLVVAGCCLGLGAFVFSRLRDTLSETV
ncbi:MAG: ABC transporter permease [Acidobacteriota bacterium]